MTRLLGWSLVVLVAVAAVINIREETMSGPLRYDPDSVTEIVLEVDGREYHQEWDVAARSLVQSCSASLRSVLSEPIEELDERLFRITLHPAIDGGSHTRLRGCLNDATIDRLSGKVHELRTVPRGQDRDVPERDGL